MWMMIMIMHGDDHDHDYHVVAATDAADDDAV